MIIFEAIKEVKSKLELSSPQLSKMLGYRSPSHLWAIEHGYRKPSLLLCKRLIRIAHDYANLSLTIDELLGEKNDAGSSKTQ